MNKLSSDLLQKMSVYLPLYPKYIYLLCNIHTLNIFINESV